MIKNFLPKKYSYWILLIAYLFLEVWLSPATAQISEKQVKFFETKIATSVMGVSNPDKVEKELVLTSADGIRQSGQSGSVIVAGKPDKSLLIQAIRHSTPGLQMPADKLPSEVIGNFECRVEEGAFDPRNDTNYETKGLVESNKKYDFSQGLKHWAYQPLRKPELPEVSDVDWVRSPINRFILSKLAEHGLKQMGPATKDNSFVDLPTT